MYDVFIKRRSKLNLSVVYSTENEQDNLDFYYHNLNCEIIDVVNYSPDIAIIIDDEGFLKSGQPIYELTDSKGNKMRLAGTLLFAQSHYDNGEVTLKGLSKSQAFHIMTNMKIKMLGFTN